MRQVQNTVGVSVVMPFLDEARFIDEAIESVISQTYHRWELLLVDDGSTDGSTAIAQRYAALLPGKIRYLRHPKHATLGAGPSRNLGVGSARGTYVAFLDADDVWMPTKLEEHVALLDKRSSAALLYGKTLFWHFDNGRPPGAEPDFVQDLGVAGITLVQPPGLLERLLRNEDIHPAICSWLVRREAFAALGGFDSRFDGLYEDTVFLAKAFLRRPVLVSDDCLAIYRIHADSSCHVAVEAGEYHETEPNRARETFLKWLERHLSDQGIADASVWHALRHELWPYEHPHQYEFVRIARNARRAAGRARRLFHRNSGDSAIPGPRRRDDA